MLKLISSTIAVAALTLSATAQVTFEAKDGPGKGKHVVLLAGDEEYRSEEGLPMLARVLSQKHGFKCSVALSVGKDGNIDPNAQASGEGVAALDTADVCIMLVRFRHWPDETMKHFDTYVKAGKPFIALRTSTHAFNFAKETTFAKYAFNAPAESGWEGGFGKAILGETWVSHWGSHKKEATRGIITDAGKTDPLLTGVADLFGDTDVYEAHPPADAKVLVSGQVLKGMNPTDEPADYVKKLKTGDQPVNSPMQPIVWTREADNGMGSKNKVLCTTMGAATDLANEGLRRLIVNSVYAFAGLAVPEKADVTPIGDYKPTFYSPNLFIKGVKPADLLK